MMGRQVEQAALFGACLAPEDEPSYRGHGPARPGLGRQRPRVYSALLKAGDPFEILSSTKEGDPFRAALD
jgi:hypothetical protein